VGTQAFARHSLHGRVDGWRQCHAEARCNGGAGSARLVRDFQLAIGRWPGAFWAGGIIYSFVLRALPLHAAQALAAFQYVAVVLAASVLLRERIAPTSWLGIVCIVVGILLVSSALRT